MDANKEQSERCIDIAARCLNEGDKEKALKFLHKAKRLNPADTAADDLIRKITQENGTPTQNGSATFNGDYNPFEADEMFTRSRFSSSKSNPDFPKHKAENSSSGRSGRAKNCNNDNNNDKASTPSSSKDEKSKFTHNNSSSNKDRSKSRNRRSSTSSTAGGAGGASQQRCTSQPQLGVDYTQEQVDMVLRVRRSKDYYEILNVTKEFAEIDLKKQYRKLALQFHPDKNRAPGATEAFKAIGNAYAVLSDPKKRERYDMYGTSDTSHMTSSRHHRRDTYYEYDYSRGFEADMTAEEIFNMFFGGGFPQGNLRRRHNGHAQHSADAERRTETGFGVLLQLMPILILILLSIFSQLLVSDPPFSLKYTQKYTEERQTPELKVTYYVKPDFMKNFHGQIHRIEQQVDEEYIDNLRTMCFKEKNQRETLFWQARLYGDQKLYERAQQLPLHSCVRLSNIYK